VPARPTPDRVFDGQPDFDEALLAGMRARPFFRLATDEEVDASFEPYVRGDIPSLIAAWERHASPVRASLEGIHGFMYRQAAHLPRRMMGLAFLSLTRGVLEAGRRFRDQLPEEVCAAIATEFPWLEARHEHVPPGWAPPFSFPPSFAAFLTSGTLDDARVRWQLSTALNEVQQAHGSQAMAAQFGLPELARQADRERELALNYFAHWSPRATRALWAQTIHVLDDLNAAVYAALGGKGGNGIRLRALWGAIRGSREWSAFREGLERPQRLLPPS
jgi:hypothetical protein